ncbi:MAG: hypothetical protein J6X16_01505 [Bacteroidales bacterium]|nr:hypothetical protein [Bacteroidales bacterium]
MSYSIKERITHITERWWLTEPTFFAVYCSHLLSENEQMKCVMRTGERRIEYNPALAGMLSDEALEEYLKVECLHILLKHPYERQPECCKPESIAIAGNFVVDQNYRLCHFECPKAHEFQLPIGESFEWYALKLNNLIGKSGDNSDDSWIPSDGKQTLEGDNDEGPSPKDSDYKSDQRWADYSGLWEEDMLAQEETNELIRKLEASQSWGTIPGHFAEMVVATLKVKLNYKAILRSFHTSILCSRRRLTRMRPNRRSGFQQMGSRYELASNILVCVDVSGSVSSDALSTFYSATARFFKYGVETIYVLPFDAGLKELITLKKAPKEVKIEGRGGTNFQILFDYIAKHPHYDGMIIFTDGHASEPKVPQPMQTKVLWICDCEQNYERHREWMRKSGKAAFIRE